MPCDSKGSNGRSRPDGLWDLARCRCLSGVFQRNLQKSCQDMGGDEWHVQETTNPNLAAKGRPHNEAWVRQGKWAWVKTHIRRKPSISLGLDVHWVSHDFQTSFLPFPLKLLTLNPRSPGTVTTTNIAVICQSRYVFSRPCSSVYSLEILSIQRVP